MRFAVSRLSAVLAALLGLAMLAFTGGAAFKGW